MPDARIASGAGFPFYQFHRIAPPSQTLPVMNRLSLVLLGMMLGGPAALGSSNSGIALRIDTAEGSVDGSLGPDGTVRMFLGIPYAEPPSGRGAGARPDLSNGGTTC